MQQQTACTKGDYFSVGSPVINLDAWVLDACALGICEASVIVACGGMQAMEVDEKGASRWFQKC